MEIVVLEKSVPPYVPLELTARQEVPHLLYAHQASTKTQLDKVFVRHAQQDPIANIVEPHLRLLAQLANIAHRAL